MALQHGKDTYVSVNGKNISPYCSQCDYNLSADMHDTTTFGNSAHKFSPGLTTGTISLSGFFEAPAVSGSPREVFDPLLRTPSEVVFVRRPRGTGSSLPYDQANVLVSAYNESSPVADMITWTAELQISGPTVTGSQ